MQRKYVARNVGYPIIFNAKKSEQGLGLVYRNTKTTLNDHVTQLISANII